MNAPNESGSAGATISSESAWKGSVAPSIKPVYAQARTQARSRRFWRQEWFLFLLFVSPNLLLFAIFSYWPMLYNAYLSLVRWNMIAPTKTWVGLDNYDRLIRDETWWTAVRNTVLYAVIKLAIELPLALVIALVLSSKLRGATFFRTVGFLPVVTSIAVVSLAFTFFFSPLGGPFNTVLLDLGFDFIEFYLLVVRHGKSSRLSAQNFVNSRPEKLRLTDTTTSCRGRLTGRKRRRSLYLSTNWIVVGQRMRLPCSNV